MSERVDTDRNLLFGILALQLEYINATQFTEACAGWAVAKQKTLAEILVQRGWMTVGESNEVEQLVERKIKNQAGDVHQTLILEATGDLPHSKAAASWAAGAGNSAPSRDSAGLDMTRSSSPSDSTPSGYEQMETIDYETVQERSRYSLTKLHGEGGIGRVWQAHDQRLNRQVALKEIRPEKGTSPTAAKRFAKEAQITSQLEHPNIVPVYELSGEPNSSRSFYTMRFVRGDTFRDAIDAYHRHRREGTATALELRDLLNSFIAICNALGYAHSRGVLHRDLKPSNVMVGSFGEVVVLDWGLAKMIDQPDDEDNLLESGPISITEDVEIDATMQGSVLGTLPYMAPEQAAGRIDKIDTRTDIYGLGAILFAILTGNHPHHGSSTRELRSQIMNEPTPRVRAENAKIHPGLDAICAKAMAKKRSDRYAKARDLAEDVRRWLADEPVDCYAEPLLVRVGRWLRRHRTWTQSIAAALLIVTAVSVASVMIVDRARRNAIDAQGRAEASYLAEQAAKAEATRRFEEARNAVDTMMTGVSEVLAYFPGMQQLRERLLQQAVERYEQFAADKSDDPQLQAETARAMIRLGDVFRALSKYDLAQSSYEKAAQRMQSLYDRDPRSRDVGTQLAVAKSKSGLLHADLGEPEPAEQAYVEALRLFDELLHTEIDPQLEHQRAGVIVNRAMLQHQRGQPEAALTDLAEANQVFQRLVAERDNPEFAAGLAMTEVNIANVLIGAGRNSDAISHAGEAISLYRTLSSKFPDHPPYLEALATTRLNLAAAYRTSGRDHEELSAYQAALLDFDLLIKSRSDVPVYRERHASVLRELATYWHTVGNNHDALQAISLAIETTETLLNTQGPLARYCEQLALEQATLGRVLSDLGQDEQATLYLGDAIEGYDALIEQDPSFSDSYQLQRAACQSALGTLYQKMGDEEMARLTLEQAAATFQRLSDQDSGQPDYQNALAWTYSYLAELHWQMEQPEPARGYYQKALMLRRALVVEPEHLNSLARLIVACREPELATGEEAIEAAEKASSQAPENARFASTLGSAYAQFGRYTDAIKTLQTVKNLTPHGGTTHDFWLAFALAKRNAAGDIEAARNRFKEALDRMQAHAPGRSELMRLRSEFEPLLANSPAALETEQSSALRGLD